MNWRVKCHVDGSIWHIYMRPLKVWIHIYLFILHYWRVQIQHTEQSVSKQHIVQNVQTKMAEWMNEMMNEWTNERTNDRMNERTNERSNERTNAWIYKWMNDYTNEWINEWKNEWVNKWWMNEWMSEWMNIQNNELNRLLFGQTFVKNSNLTRSSGLKILVVNISLTSSLI